MKNVTVLNETVVYVYVCVCVCVYTFICIHFVCIQYVRKRYRSSNERSLLLTVVDFVAVVVVVSSMSSRQRCSLSAFGSHGAFRSKWIQTTRIYTVPIPCTHTHTDTFSNCVWSDEFYEYGCGASVSLCVCTCEPFLPFHSTCAHFCLALDRLLIGICCFHPHPIRSFEFPKPPALDTTQRLCLHVYIAMRHRWTKLAATIRIHHPIIRSASRAPIHWPPQRIHVSVCCCWHNSVCMCAYYMCECVSALNVCVSAVLRGLLSDRTIVRFLRLIAISGSVILRAIDVSTFRCVCVLCDRCKRPSQTSLCPRHQHGAGDGGRSETGELLCRTGEPIRRETTQQ